MEILRLILVLIIVTAAVLLSIGAGVDATVKCITYHACKNTYSQTANFTVCNEMTFETLIQKVRVEK